MRDLPDDLPEQVSRALREDIGPRRRHRARSFPAGQHAARARHHARGRDRSAAPPGSTRPSASSMPRIASHWQARDGDRGRADSVCCELARPGARAS